MKQIIHIIIFLLVPLCLLAQSTSQNYILTRVYQTADSAKYLDQIQYFDGLGRPVETVQKAQSLKGNTWVDLVNLTEYDGVGRYYKHWLPAPATGSAGAFVASADFAGLANTQYTSSEKPYTTIEYEPSPLNRVTGQYGAGNDWYAGTKKVKTDYVANDANEVARFYVNNSNQLQCDAGGYAANTLYKTKVADEDGYPTTEYKDKLGQLVMKQSILSVSVKVNTYYVYDDLGRLRYVLPPLAADALTAGVIADNAPVLVQYGYLYKYDERGNNIEKRLPGCDPIYMVYDKVNRLVLSQDGNQRDKSRKPIRQWTVIKYDLLGRVVFTGVVPNDSTKDQFKAVYSTKLITETYTSGTGYSTNYFGSAKPLTLNFYDDYTFTSLAINASNLNWAGSNLNWVNPPAGYDAKYTPPLGVKEAAGLLTGTRTYLLDKDGTNCLTNALYYDDRGRVVQTRAYNHLGGYDYTYNHYDFTGRVLKTYKVHNTATQTDVPETYTYAYDNAGRPTTTKYKIFADSAVLTNNVYDELGRVKYTYRHGGADTISYAYNIRNWTTMIKSGTFAETLNYYNILHMGVIGCYNGNISCATYNYNGTYRTYDYSYDPLNRLLSATSVQVSGGYPTSYINKEEFTYDKLGNIQTLRRQNVTTPVDNLVMTYSGNQVKSITDSNGSQGLYNVKEYQNKANTTDEMSYDKNGNLTKDLDRDIVTIRYNILNLPDTIQFKYGDQIINRYAADGRKLYTEYFTKLIQLATPIDTGGVYSWVYNRSLYSLKGNDYVGNMEYSSAVNTAGTKTHSLLRVHNPEGYTDNFNSSFMSTWFYYFRRDHLGNTREVWRAPYIVYAYGNRTDPASVVQRTQYYPSGLPWSEGMVPDWQPYKYNGKEFVEMNGYDTYDFGWRGMYPAICRFSTIDPHAERYYNVSPYAYCANNPVSHVDPTGMDSTYYNSNGNVIYSCGNDPDINNSYVIKTTQTTDEMYSESPDDPDNGNSNPIAKDQANGSIDLVSNGNLTGDQMDDFVEIPNPTAGANIRKEIKDDGTGGTSPKNNMEYGMNINGAGEVINFTTGKVGNPDVKKTNVSVDMRENHDHPSGVGENGGTWRQPPSKTDINNMSAGYNRNVWGMRSKTVYVINSTGVIATIPMKIYKK